MQLAGAAPQTDSSIEGGLEMCIFEKQPGDSDACGPYSEKCSALMVGRKQDFVKKPQA